MAFVADLVLEHLRAIRSDFAMLRDDVRDSKIRMTGVEEGLAGVNRRLDRIEDRVKHIETRLDLVGAVE